MNFTPVFHRMIYLQLEKLMQLEYKQQQQEQRLQGTALISFYINIDDFDISYFSARRRQLNAIEIYYDFSYASLGF